jgi:D-3-phosphoglycerate dehydrogenase
MTISTLSYLKNFVILSTLDCEKNLKQGVNAAMTKILITDGLDQSALEILGPAGEVVDSNGISADDLLTAIADVDALIVRGRTKVTPAVFDAAKKLKVVGRAGVGVDNIDLTSAKEHGVTVVNAPIATTIAVAELALSLMLAITREIPRADATMKAGKWIKKELEGIEMYGKTLGVIGFGRIGSETAKRAAAFGMKILACDPVADPKRVAECNAENVTLDELCARADFITIHTPLNNSTRNLINAEAIAKMKPGVRIVTVARGGVVDEAALLEGLNSGKVAAAALDVYAVEPTTNTDLVNHPHVVCTPHIGAQTAEAQVRAAEDIASEVLAALHGEALRWKVA